MSITLYHARFARSFRVRLMLEELGLPYDLRWTALNHGDVGGADYKAVFPLQKLPAIEIDGRVMCESTAIIEYLAATQKDGAFAAKLGDDDYGEYLQWLHFGEAGFGPNLNMFLGHTFVLPEAQRKPAIAEWAWGELNKQFGFLAQALDGREYILERGFTAADVSLGYPMLMSKLARRLPTAPQAVQDYFERLKSRPAWQRASEAETADA